MHVENDAEGNAFDAAVAAFEQSTEHGVGSMVELLRLDCAAGRISAEGLERLSMRANSDGSARIAIEPAGRIAHTKSGCDLPRLINERQLSRGRLRGARRRPRTPGQRHATARRPPGISRIMPIIDAVVSSPDRPWGAGSRATATTDSQCILAAPLAAVHAQGLRRDYRYVIEPLYNEATARRAARNRAMNGEAGETIDPRLRTSVHRKPEDW